MARSSSRNRKIVPESQQAINEWKYEIAAELGLAVGPYAVYDFDSEFATELGERSPAHALSEDWGHIASRDTGVVGGTITARLIQKAQADLLNL